MRVVSTNTGKTRTYEFNGATVSSSMRREPTLDGLTIHFARVEGDKFAVPKMHGIKEAVVYAFSASVFPELSRLLTQEVSVGNVGENLTIDELDESKIFIGDEYEVGSARLLVTGPRYPCNRLNFCFQREDAQTLFAELRRPGVYFEVLKEGHAHRGDELKLVKSTGGEMSVLDLFDALTARKQFASKRISEHEFAEISKRVRGNPRVPAYIREKF